MQNARSAPVTLFTAAKAKLKKPANRLRPLSTFHCLHGKKHSKSSLKSPEDTPGIGWDTSKSLIFPPKA
ncbi:unnamed protein product [Parnassius apollo]|uniref:(apollo) hypothetical protein n=1 Tax=Parnassius apollo TaxID=110799 RepID=A0A8S3WSH0_PARAO|nr:unnamed protein product [Parnassius apollo]